MASYLKRTTKNKGTVYDVVFWYEKDGKKIQKKLCGYQTKRDAQKAAEDFLRELQAPILQFDNDSNSSTSFVNVFKCYLDAKQGILSAITIYNIQDYFNIHILPSFSTKQIYNIACADIIAWQQRMWNKKGKDGELLSQKTCVTAYKYFKTFIEWTVEKYSLKINPFEGVQYPHRREQKKEMQIWTPEQFALFLSKVSKDSHKVFFILLYFSGCRFGEINALTKDDFIKENDHYSLKISKSISFVPGKGYIITPPKTDTGNRTVSLPSGLTKILEDYLNDKEGLIWGLNRSGVNAIFSKAIKKANLPHIRVHDLRHSHASLLISAGIPITTVSKRLGHSSTEITLDTYSHCFKLDEQKILNQLNKYVKKK